MSNIVPLERTRHAALRLHPLPDVSRLRYAPLGLSEITVACADFPICLAKDGQTGRFNLIALLSLDEPRNLFWLNERWQSTYVPEVALAGPFRLDARSDFGLAIDESSPRLARAGAPLFTPEGQPTEVLSAVRTVLERVRDDVAEAQKMVERFAELRLVRQLSVVLTRADGAEHQIDGLYSLSSEALAALSDETVVSLYRDGYIAAASILRASLSQMERLRQLQHASSRVPWHTLRVHVVES
jgi:hypothetical protein